jgi:hypothetical protein
MVEVRDNRDMYRLFPAVLAALPIALFAPLSFAIEPTTQLQIHVTNTEGKAVGNASVIVRFVPDRAIKIKHTKTSWELRTSQQGMVKIPEIPQGKVQIQVIAKNYQTYGNTFDVQQEEKTLEIVLNPPQPQYSVDGPGDPRKK